MKMRELLKELFFADKSTKTVLNTSNFTEDEIKCCALNDDSPTVGVLIEVLLERDVFLLDREVTIAGYHIKSVEYHNDHLKKHRFYELKVMEE